MKKVFIIIATVSYLFVPGISDGAQSNEEYEQIGLADPRAAHIRKLVKGYEKMLSKDYIPTLKDAEYYEGEEESPDGTIGLLYCLMTGEIDKKYSVNFYDKMMNWEYDPWNENEPGCSHYDMHGDGPSMYYAWLRKKLPLSAKMKISNIVLLNDMEKPKKVPIVYYVYVMVGTKQVKFANPANPGDEEHDGRLQVREINGRDIRQILRHDVNNYKNGYMDFILEIGKSPYTVK